VKGEHLAGLGRAEAPLSHQVDREEGDDKARQPIDDESQPDCPEDAGQTAGGGGEPAAEGGAQGKFGCTIAWHAVPVVWTTRRQNRADRGDLLLKLFQFHDWGWIGSLRLPQDLTCAARRTLIV